MRLTFALLSLLSFSVLAKPIHVAVEYRIDGQLHEGYYVYDSADQRPKPLVVMVPNWLGVTPAALAKAERVAATDYVVFVADLYGKDRKPADASEAGAAVGTLYKDRALLRKRANASIDRALAALGSVDVPVQKDAVGAIGFCFGGATVLEVARSGRALQGGVVSFHGNLSLAAPAENRPLQTPVLVLHGAADPIVPRAEVEAFETEMAAAGADWQLVSYGGAVHSFTDPFARAPGQAMYDEKTANRAFALMRAFFAESFATGG